MAGPGHFHLDSDWQETIAALATPPGKGAIAIVRISGPDAAAVAARFFRSRGALVPRTATLGEVLDERGERIDRAMAILFRAPHSYTGEDALELHLHGSPAVVREVLRALIASGVRYAQPGEFTKRALLRGKMDLHEVEAVADLIDAQTRSAARAALANLGGGLSSSVAALRGEIAAISEDLAGAIDFPDEVPEPSAAFLQTAVERLASALDRMLRDGEAGRLVREGISVAIVGPPNAGKSSLLNALLGEDRAIVSEIAGTTRDTIEETIEVHGVPVRLIDTAGIRAHADRIESAGIERTQRAIASARIVLVVLDGSAELQPEARSVLSSTADRTRILFCNKSDLGTAGARDLAGAIVGSVRDPATLRALRKAISQEGWGGELPDLERPHLAAAYEFEAIREARDALAQAAQTLQRGDPVDLIAGELQRAHAALGHLTGEQATAELLAGIFARFCIGK